MLSKYKIPILIPAAIPGSPLLTLFSNCVRHIAHCAIDPLTDDRSKKQASKYTLFNIFSRLNIIRADHQIYNNTGYSHIQPNRKRIFC